MLHQISSHERLPHCVKCESVNTTCLCAIAMVSNKDKLNDIMDLDITYIVCHVLCEITVLKWRRLRPVDLTELDQICIILLYLGA